MIGATKDDVNDRHEPSLDEINELVIQIKSLSVKVGDFNTSYSCYAVSLDDLTDGIHKTFHRSSATALKSKSGLSCHVTMHGFVTK